MDRVSETHPAFTQKYQSEMSYSFLTINTMGRIILYVLAILSLFFLVGKAVNKFANAAADSAPIELGYPNMLSTSEYKGDFICLSYAVPNLAQMI